jgi:DTW domain-containing protein YfiP
VPDQELIAPAVPRMRSRKVTRCCGCGLYPELCVCASLPALEARVEVVVLMHRLERFKSTNTGRLAARSLARGQSVIRDRLAPPVVAAVPRSYVLFPRPDALPLTAATAGGIDRLIVPDGTWPQAARLTRRDPLCAGLPCVKLTSTRPSRYVLRRSDRPDALCTFEAIAEALRILENDAVADRMHAAFIPWIERSLEIRAGAHERRRPPTR